MCKIRKNSNVFLQPYWCSVLPQTGACFLLQNIHVFPSKSLHMSILWGEFMTWDILNPSSFFRDSDEQTTAVMAPFIRPERGNIRALLSHREVNFENLFLCEQTE